MASDLTPLGNMAPSMWPPVAPNYGSATAPVPSMTALGNMNPALRPSVVPNPGASLIPLPASLGNAKDAAAAAAKSKLTPLGNMNPNLRPPVVPNAVAPETHPFFENPADFLSRMYPRAADVLSAGGANQPGTSPGYAAGRMASAGAAAIPAAIADMGEGMFGKGPATMGKSVTDFGRGALGMPPNAVPAMAPAPAAAPVHAPWLASGSGMAHDAVYGDAPPGSPSAMKDAAGVGRGAVLIDATPQGPGDAVGIGQRNTIYREGPTIAQRQAGATGQTTYTGKGVPAGGAGMVSPGNPAMAFYRQMFDAMNRAKTSGDTAGYSNAARMLAGMTPALLGHEPAMGHLGLAMKQHELTAALSDPVLLGNARFRELMAMKDPSEKDKLELASMIRISKGGVSQQTQLVTMGQAPYAGPAGYGTPYWGGQNVAPGM
jgi:hypothetical protein